MTDADDEIPWERRGELGVARAFRDTLLLSGRQPTRFYGLAPRGPSSWSALAYGFSFELVVAVVTFAYARTFGLTEFHESLAPLRPQIDQLIPQAPAMIDQLMGVSAIASLVTSPLAYLFNLGTTTFLTWIGLRLTGNLRTSYAHLLRQFAYASWIQIFGLLGVTGNVLLSLAGSCLVLGLGSWYWLVIVRESQRISTLKAVHASMCGCAVALALGCVVGVPAAAGIAWFLVQNLPAPPR